MANIKKDDDKLQQIIGDDGYFVVSKKTIRWAVGILTTVLGLLWGFLQNGIADANKKAEETNKTLTELVRALQNEEIKPLEDKVQKLEITDAVLLERTNSKIKTTNTIGNKPINLNTSPPD